MPCLTVVCGAQRIVVAAPATLDGWGDWTVAELLRHELPRRLPEASASGQAEQLRDGAGNLLEPHLPLAALRLHPGQVLHAVSKRDGADGVPVPAEFAADATAEPASYWAVEAVNRAMVERDRLVEGIDSLARGAASSNASNDGSSTDRSERTLAALTGAIQRRGEVVERIDATFDAGRSALDRKPPASRPVSEWPLAPYSASRGEAGLPPYYERRYTVDNHTDEAPNFPRARPAQADAAAPEEADAAEKASGGMVSQWKKLELALKVRPGKRLAMGGMPIRNTDLLAPSSEPPEPAPEPVFVVPEAPPPPEPEPEPLSVYPSRFLRSSGNDFL